MLGIAPTGNGVTIKGIDVLRVAEGRIVERLCGYTRDSCKLRLARRYQFQNTKSPELIFSALVGDDGTRNVRFERALST